MKVEQLIYTSCKVGLGPIDGYQSQAKSPGLDPGDRDELERVPMLKRPADLLPTASPSEIAAVCPAGYFGRRLASGRLAVTRRIYVGLDYSERPGNSVLHSLVFDSVPPFALIDLRHWTGWIDVATLEPPVLGTLGESDFIAIPPAGSATVERSFLSCVPGRTGILAKLVDALLDGIGDPSGSSAFCIFSDPASLTDWCSCLLKTVPMSDGMIFSFLTSADRPTIKADLRATCENDRSEFESVGLRIVDTGIAPAGKPPSALASKLASLLALDPSGFDRLREFAAAFEVSPTRESLTAITALAGSLAQPDGATVVRLLKFAAEFGRKHRLIEPRLIELLQSTNPAALRAAPLDELFDALIGVCGRAGSDRLSAVAEAFLIRLGLDAALDGRSSAEADGALTRISIGTRPKPDRLALVGDAITDDLVRRILDHPKTFQRLLGFVSPGRAQPGPSPWKDPRPTAWVLTFLDRARSPELLTPLLQFVNDQSDPGTFAEFCQAILEAGAGKSSAWTPRIEDLAEAVAAATGGHKGGERANQVRSALIALGSADLACHEIRSWLPEASTDEAMAVLSLFDGSKKKLIPELTEPFSEMARDLPPQDLMKFADGFVRRSDWFGLLDANAADLILRALDGSLSLNPDDSESADRVRQMTARGCAKMKPPFPRLSARALTARCVDEKARAGPPSKFVASVVASGSGPDLMSEQLDFVFPYLLDRCRGYDDFLGLIKAITDAEESATARRLMGAIANHPGRPLSTDAISWITIGWLWSRLHKRDKHQLPDKAAKELEQPVTALLLSLSKSDWAAVTRAVDGDEKNPTPIWDVVRPDLERRRRPAVVKVGHMLASGFHAIGSILRRPK